MEKTAQNTHSSIQRDYDKDPIVIEDYNYIFLFIDAIYTIPILLLIYIYNPGDVSEESLFRHVFIIVPIMMIPAVIGYKSYRFYDAIIIFSGDKFINILPTTLDEYNEVKKYFRTKKQIELATTKVFYELFGHMPEKINLEGNK